MIIIKITLTTRETKSLVKSVTVVEFKLPLAAKANNAECKQWGSCKMQRKEFY